jgi:hypothetical protein
VPPCSGGAAWTSSPSSPVLPLQVAGDLIGLPRDGREDLLAMSTASFNTLGPANQRTREGIPLLAGAFTNLEGLPRRENILPDGWGAAYYAADAGRMEVAEVMTTNFFPDSDRTV